MLRKAGRHIILSATLLLVACLSLGCSNEREEANKLVDEINSLRERAAQLGEQAIAKESELEQLNLAADRDRVRAVAQEQIGLHRQSAALFNEAAGRAEQAAGKLKPDDWFKQYLDLKARQFRKSAELQDLQRAQAEVWLTDAPVEEMKARLSQAKDAAMKVVDEVIELDKQVQTMEQENRANIRGAS